MKNIAGVILLLSFACFACGQEVSRFEIFGGYSYADRLQLPLAASSSNNGWEAAFKYNLTSRLGLVAAVDGRAGTDFRSTQLADGTAVFLRRPVSTYSFLFGPEVNVYRYRRVSINLRALAGFVHADDSNANVSVFSTNPLPNFIATRTFVNNTFSMAAGGNLDIRLKGGLSLRAIQPEMQLTRINGGSQPNFRIATGLVYSFGKR